MQYPTANKALGIRDPAVNSEKYCHLCRRPIGPRSCRQVELGWMCMQHGLILGYGQRLITPITERPPWETDPVVVAAAQTETAAQQEYDAANIAWETAVRKLAEHKILTTFNPLQGWASPDGKTHTRGRDKQLKAEVTARQQRDNAGAALAKARVAYQRALEKARHAALSAEPDHA
jgi:hypothetical protein